MMFQFYSNFACRVGFQLVFLLEMFNLKFKNKMYILCSLEILIDVYMCVCVCVSYFCLTFLIIYFYLLIFATVFVVSTY